MLQERTFDFLQEFRQREGLSCLGDGLQQENGMETGIGQEEWAR